jgi:hypothetical protein
MDSQGSPWPSLNILDKSVFYQDFLMHTKTQVVFCVFFNIYRYKFTDSHDSMGIPMESPEHRRCSVHFTMFPHLYSVQQYPEHSLFSVLFRPFRPKTQKTKCETAHFGKGSESQPAIAQWFGSFDRGGGQNDPSLEDPRARNI